VFLRVEWHVDDFGICVRGMERGRSIRVIGHTASQKHASRADGPACIALVHRRVRPQRSVRTLRCGLSDYNPTEVKQYISILLDLKHRRRISGVTHYNYNARRRTYTLRASLVDAYSVLVVHIILLLIHANQHNRDRL